MDSIMMYRKTTKNLGEFSGSTSFLKQVELKMLVWSFRNTAGLSTPGVAYGGWEAPDCELRGHFVGHYLSASALMWASTHNETLKKKMSAVVSALHDCQNKMGTGYLSAFPSEQFDRFEALKPVWAPYYTIHKILAGLLDQYTLANNTGSLEMALNEETGGMNDVLYKLYSITGNQKHFTLAQLFDKPCFLGLLAVKADDISGFHANTHIPIVIGSQMRYELTGDPLYKEIGKFFMDIVNSSYTYATGGTSHGEFWKDPKRLASFLDAENEESCTTYNMLKVSRNLFRWTKKVGYADYYERTLTNGVLSIQRGREPGIMIYMLPLGHGESKARSANEGWGTKYDSFWCCYGTGIESFSKLGDSIYFEEEGKVPGIYIIQYISSSFNWNSQNIVINLKVEPVVSWDGHLHVAVIISSNKQKEASTLNFRVPSWANTEAANAFLNDQKLFLPNPGSFLSITREWSSSDKITLELPMSIRLEALQDDRREYASDHAILYGPYLLVGLSSGERNINTDTAVSTFDWITPIPAAYNSHLITLSQEFKNNSFVLTNSNKSITVGMLPESGSNHSVYATFRLVLRNPTSTELLVPEDCIGKTVGLEPFDLPGMVVVERGINQSLGVEDAIGNSDSTFILVQGLDGKSETVSLESARHRGCFVYSSLDLHSSVKLKCSAGSSDVKFKQAASFRLRDGISKYDPISFVAKGEKRNFLLQPILSLRDENYVVYFKIQSNKLSAEF
ncbi:putative alpha-L-arabinofuranosidase B, arabinose-binding domain-containing protein [Heracleum sosnowskyi]|uniref:Alpha-L-arabinofuranosidase B, arabinose-binding domain-containing protein n=1 Tax=Heracleum sosnowskyi TaxID=360622 RepID=A0AAD8IH39_9APIA|nr:putative alpha-L-arabinofuranosidase B, arabinose-binding domain-containing protein [Heracleum sosnowskyi]